MGEATKELSMNGDRCITSIKHLHIPHASKLPLRPHTLSTICQRKPNGSSELAGWGAAALSRIRRLQVHSFQMHECLISYPMRVSCNTDLSCSGFI